MKIGLIFVIMLCISNTQNQNLTSPPPTSQMMISSSTPKLDQDKNSTSPPPTSAMMNSSSTTKLHQYKNMTSLTPTSAIMNSLSTTKLHKDKNLTSLPLTPKMTNASSTMQPYQDKTLSAVKNTMMNASNTYTIKLNAISPTLIMMTPSSTTKPNQSKTSIATAPFPVTMTTSSTTKLDQNKTVIANASILIMMTPSSTTELNQSKTSIATAPFPVTMTTSIISKLDQNKTVIANASTLIMMIPSSTTKLNQSNTSIAITPIPVMMTTSSTTKPDQSKTVIAISPNSSKSTIMSNTSGRIFPTATSIIHSSISSSSFVSPTPKSKKLLKLSVCIVYYKREFIKNLKNKESQEFLIMKIKVEVEINEAYKNNSITIEKFLSVDITGFLPGSIISVGQLYFMNSTEDDVAGLKKILSDYGEIHGFTVTNFQRATDDDDDDDDVILGLHWWQIGVVIGGVVAFILLITVIVLCCKISRMKKNGRGDMSYASSLYYDHIDEPEEMKTLRASPSKMNSESNSTPRNGDVESGPRKVNMYSSSSLVDAKQDGLVNQTSSKVGKDNPGTDVDENDYVTIMDVAPGAGDVVKL